jgi:hypothetical protein
MSDETKFQEQINDEPFLLFCETVTKNVGAASIEVLHAWFYNTFNTNKTTKNEISKTK